MCRSTHQFMFNSSSIDARAFLDPLQFAPNEYELIPNRKFFNIF